MTRPNNRNITIAMHWIENAENSWAWEDLDEMVQRNPSKAWRLIRVMIAFAPDLGTLWAVAAGPLESLIEQHRRKYMPIIQKEVGRSERFRRCLRGVYSDLPRRLSKIICKDEANELPLRRVKEPRLRPSVGDTVLMVTWFHHSDTSWASSLLGDMIREEPDSAWEVISLLLRLANDVPSVREDIYLQAFDTFLRQNIETHRDVILKAVLHEPALKEWILTSKQPRLADVNSWNSLIRDVSAV